MRGLRRRTIEPTRRIRHCGSSATPRPSPQTTRGRSSIPPGPPLRHAWRAGDAEGELEALTKLATIAPAAGIAAAAARRLLELHRFKEGFAVLRDAARRIPGWRAQLLPVVVPVQVYARSSTEALVMLVAATVLSIGSQAFWPLAALSVAYVTLFQYAVRSGGRLGRGIRHLSLQRFRKRHPPPELDDS
jgi:hypothetical protein